MPLLVTLNLGKEWIYEQSLEPKVFINGIASISAVCVASYTNIYSTFPL